jgi:subtilisin-like proprotein convertase family protein
MSIPGTIRTAATVCAMIAAIATFGARPAVAQTFTNPSPITINAINEATPYPSNILVSGMAGAVTKLRVTLTGLSHSFPADIGVLLVGPAGQNLVLMNDVGGSIDITDVDMVFDDDALEDVLIGVKIESGSFKPTDVNAGENFQAPAPALSGATTLATFNGTNPNGIWSLYLHDDASGDPGSLAGGWSVNFAPETG